jgi:hypothetical protein
MSPPSTNIVTANQVTNSELTNVAITDAAASVGPVMLPKRLSEAPGFTRASGFQGQGKTWLIIRIGSAKNKN